MLRRAMLNRIRASMSAAGPLIPVLLCALGCGGSPDAPIDVPVRVGLVGLDSRNVPVIVLEEEGGPRWLPIWIGKAEASSIANEIEQRVPPRPNSHDFAKRVIEELEAGVGQVVVTELRNGTFFAVFTLNDGDRAIEIDARPSDAIAVALRFGAPILVRESLFEEAGRSSDEKKPERSVRWDAPPTRVDENEPESSEMRL